jgi:hypothetical protein
VTALAQPLDDTGFGRIVRFPQFAECRQKSRVTWRGWSLGVCWKDDTPKDEQKHEQQPLPARREISHYL